MNHIDIAGTFTTINKNLIIDAKFNLLSESGSNADASRKGVKAELHGGRFPIDNKKNGRDQMAIIEFVCDPERTGDEGDETEEPDKSGDNDDDKKEKEGDDKDKDNDKKDGEKPQLRRRDGEETGKCQDSDASLRFCGYSAEDIKKDTKTNVLRLEWRTKYACKDTKPEDGGSHWGFFTWFIIM